MGRKLMTGLTTGAILGAAAGMLLMPELDRSTRKRIKKSGKIMRNTAGDMYDNMKNWIK
jgi:gas vesicle protein